MWQYTYSKIFPDLTKESVWAIWCDVNHWSTWDSELEYCHLEDDFIEGASFILKPKGAPKIKIILEKVIPNQRFLDSCRFFGAILYDDHLLEETESGLKITNIISVKGWLSFLWVRLVAKSMVKSIPDNIDQLVELARGK